MIRMSPLTDKSGITRDKGFLLCFTGGKGSFIIRIGGSCKEINTVISFAYRNLQGISVTSHTVGSIFLTQLERNLIHSQ